MTIIPSTCHRFASRVGTTRPPENDTTLKKRAAAGLAGLTLAVCFLGACAAQRPAVRYQGDLTPIETVVIVPFENLAERYEPDTGVRSPISGRVFVTGPATAAADRFLTDLLVSHVRRDTAFEILPTDDPAVNPNAFDEGRGRDAQRLERLSQNGRRLGADAVFAGHVYRFRERVGGGFSVESPASVAFEIYLIDCRQPRVLWSAVYDYTQQALSDNLFGLGNFWRRGGRWVTAAELATAAMEDIFDDFRRGKLSPAAIDSKSN
jgi:hypothetical protein